MVCVQSQSKVKQKYDSNEICKNIQPGNTFFD